MPLPTAWTRAQFLLAAPLAVAVLLLAASGLGAGLVQAERAAHRPPAAAAPSAYERARERGQPVGVLRHAAVLRATPGGRPLARLARRTEFGSPRVLATLEERGNWLRVMASQLPNGRSGWIPASAATVVVSPFRVRADLSRREVTVFRSGRVVRRFPVAIGKPGTPTPRGRFAVTDKLFISGGGSYGCCALALTGHQPHIEPGWQGGDRLAIHGTSRPDTIGYAASFGCLRARAADVRWLVRRVYLGSIVVIRA